MFQIYIQHHNGTGRWTLEDSTSRTLSEAKSRIAGWKQNRRETLRELKRGLRPAESFTYADAARIYHHGKKVYEVTFH